MVIKVAIGIPAMESVPLAFFHSFNQLQRLEGTVIMTTDSKPLDKARDMLVQSALDADCTHIFFMDSDMVFPPDALIRLLKLDKPIAGGLYFRKTPPFKPLMIRYIDGGYKTVYEFPEDDIVEVDATGTGCLLIRTDVFKKMEKPWFKWDDVYSEDMYFCDSLRKRGINISIDTGVSCGHLAQTLVNKDTYRHRVKLEK